MTRGCSRIRATAVDLPSYLFRPLKGSDASPEASRDFNGQALSSEGAPPLFPILLALRGVDRAAVSR